jgi:4-diphosphocytidyl-2-C-methyl-D-erythritol kinase
MALAPAKLNLYLDVRGRRADGYHELETLFVALAWGDDIEVEVREEQGVTLEVTGDPSVPVGSENLAAKAAAAWFEAAGARAPFLGAAIRLVKRIPVGGGLGGGSSDAGTVLRLLQERAGGERALAADDLQRIAKALGADVPYFLRGGAAIGRGRGDVIEAVPQGPPLTFVLITPTWGHDTATVFRYAGQRLRPSVADGLALAVQALRSGVPERVRAAHENALALAAMRAYPAFTRFTSEVERALGRPPCLSGSGSTLFDVPDPGETEAVLLRLKHLPARVVRTTSAPAPRA